MDDADFYAHLPAFEDFAAAVDPSRYRPLPPSWWVGMTDVVGSTRAIEQGRYKAVNTAGVSAISAVANALGHQRFPFVFGGDGASFAVCSSDAPRARAALAAIVAWSRDELDLPMRAAIIPVSAAEAAGYAVGAARYSPSPHVSYAMFSGGGIAWAERAMKAGEYPVEAAPPGTRPDLSGLSCRWNEIQATRGTILSLLAAPARQDDPAFRRTIESIVGEIDASGEAVRPVPDGAAGVAWPPPGLELEVRASRRANEPLAAARLRVRIHTWFAWLIMRTGISVGGFDPARYRREVAANADVRKYDDHLRMTIDCTAALADRLEATLERARADGILRYGLYRQAAAVMTCFVPTAGASDHLHFIDGASGGYALAARAMKAR